MFLFLRVLIQFAFPYLIGSTLLDIGFEQGTNGPGFTDFLMGLDWPSWLKGTIITYSLPTGAVLTTLIPMAMAMTRTIKVTESGLLVGKEAFNLEEVRVKCRALGFAVLDVRGFTVLAFRPVIGRGAFDGQLRKFKGGN